MNSTQKQSAQQAPNAAQTQHTPGPWKAEPLINTDGRCHTWQVYAGKEGGDPNKDEYRHIVHIDDANARLIAAAPALLAALEAIAQRMALVESSLHFSDPAALRMEMRAASKQATAALSAARS